MHLALILGPFDKHHLYGGAPITIKNRTAKTKRNQKLLAIGSVGSVILAICCFTSALVIGFEAIGLSAWIGLIDVVLLPGLFVFTGLTGYPLWRLRSN